jgi:hypothetical protein
MLYLSVLHKNEDILQLLKDAILGYKQQVPFQDPSIAAVIVDALLCYHHEGEEEEPEMERDEDRKLVLQILRDNCYREVSIVSCEESRELLDVLCSVDNWSERLPFPKPKRPLLMDGDTPLSLYFSLEATPLSTIKTQISAYIDTICTPLDGDVPHRRLFQPILDAGFRFTVVGGAINHGLLGPKQILIENKIIYLADDLFHRVSDDVSAARDVFKILLSSSFNSNFEEVTHSVVETFTRDASSVPEASLQPPHVTDQNGRQEQDVLSVSSSIPVPFGSCGPGPDSDWEVEEEEEEEEEEDEEEEEEDTEGPSLKRKIDQVICDLHEIRRRVCYRA